MHILLGLGNPGPKYDLTRHNIGFAWVDSLVQSLGQTAAYTAKGGSIGVDLVGGWKTELKCLTRRFTLAGLPLLIGKPQTFMNLSGESAQALLAFYKVSPKNLIVIVDDLYLDLGAVRIRTQGGHGGHNGLRNLIEHCGDAFTRVRIGVGPLPSETDKADFVLRKYGSDEAKILEPVLARSKELLEAGLTRGWEYAGTLFNRRSPN